MRARSIACLTLLVASASIARGQEPTPSTKQGYAAAAAQAQRDLESSLAELTQLRERIAAEKVPLNGRLNDLETELSKVRAEYQQTIRLLDSRTLDLTNLRGDIKVLDDDAGYLLNLLGEYRRNFESRLHIAEIQRYEPRLEAAKLAAENSALSAEQVLQAQIALLGLSLERLDEALGGTRFEGRAVDSAGLVRPGTIAMIGPAAVFRSTDGNEIGTVEQRLGSLEPSSIAFADPALAAAAGQLVTAGEGEFPLDPSLGDAHKIEATRESLWEHILKGGPVMVPILALAAAALIVALYKWLALAFLRKPTQQKIAGVIAAVGRRDEAAAKYLASSLPGPAGKMLAAGVEHLREPRELIEEVMYEILLTTRLKLERMLPFIAISASAAPLLGLLGTVTGIISTFKMITVFGSGDVKSLSSGISEALITTEYGLIVAIPSLLLHSFLSRKARGIVAQMESAAIALINQVSKTPLAEPEPADTSRLREQVREILNELVLARQPYELPRTQPSAAAHADKPPKVREGVAAEAPRSSR